MLRIDVHPQRDAVRIATAGELDVANCGTLEAQLRELRDAGFAHVVLDLRKLTFLDSGGVRLIVREDRLARSAGQRLSLITGVGPAQRVLALCGLCDRLTFAAPPPPPALSRGATARNGRVARPELGTAFQIYLAELRQQGRASSRSSRRSRPHIQAP